MLISKGSTYRRWRFGGKEYQMVWEVLTLSSPEGATVVVVDFSQPEGQGQVFRKESHATDLDALLGEAEEFIKRLAAVSTLESD